MSRGKMNLTLSSSCKHINAKGHVGVIESSNESRDTIRDPRDDCGGIPQPHGFCVMGKQRIRRVHCYQVGYSLIWELSVGHQQEPRRLIFFVHSHQMVTGRLRISVSPQLTSIKTDIKGIWFLLVMNLFTKIIPKSNMPVVRPVNNKWSFSWDN